MSKFLLEKFSFVFRQYKKIPFPVRTRIHNFLDWFNENKYLLALIGPTRHRITHKRLSSANSPLKLIVGESYRKTGWFITNYQVFALHFLDVRREFCIKNHLTHIYADNVIEHLTASAGQTFLQNSYNALAVGGKLRLATPDSFAIAKAYLGKDKKKTNEMSRDLKSHNLKIKEPIDLLHVTFHSFGHSKGRLYDQETLTASLKLAGFRKIIRFSPGKSNDPLLIKLEKRNKISDSWSQLCIEAEK
jgi:predicted SAM-dependent methyltransferase